MEIFSSFWGNRKLISIWTRYNIQSDYIDKKLGIVWIILRPIIMTLIYTFIFGSFFDRKPRGGVPFILFFLAGMTVWQYISTCTMTAGNMYVRNIRLMSQINFPRESIAFVQIAETTIDFFITFIVLIVLSIVYGYYPSLMYLYLPLLILIIFLFNLGIMFVLGSIGVFVRDIPEITSLGIRFLFYISGVIFEPDLINAEGLTRTILNLNPVLWMVQTFRNVIIYSEAPPPGILLGLSVLSIIVVLIGFNVFRSREGVFADYS